MSVDAKLIGMRQVLCGWRDTFSALIVSIDALLEQQQGGGQLTTSVRVEDVVATADRVIADAKRARGLEAPRPAGQRRRTDRPVVDVVPGDGEPADDDDADDAGRASAAPRRIAPASAEIVEARDKAICSYVDNQGGQTFEALVRIMPAEPGQTVEKRKHACRNALTRLQLKGRLENVGGLWRAK